MEVVEVLPPPNLSYYLDSVERVILGPKGGACVLKDSETTVLKRTTTRTATVDMTISITVTPPVYQDWY